MLPPQSFHHFRRISISFTKHKELSLTSVTILHTLIIAVEELSIEQLDSNDCEDEVEEKINDEDVEHVLQWVDDTVKDSLQLRNSLDGLQWSQNSQHSQRFNNSKILCSWTPTKIKELKFLKTFFKLTSCPWWRMWWHKRPRSSPCSSTFLWGRSQGGEPDHSQESSAAPR